MTTTPVPDSARLSSAARRLVAGRAVTVSRVADLDHGSLQALAHYMAGTGVFDPEVVLEGLLRDYPDARVGLVTLPMAALLDALGHPSADAYVADFEAHTPEQYRPTHPASRWPVVLSPSDRWEPAAMDDGYHRLYAYARAGDADVRCLFLADRF
jgi:hypothetical protein